MMRVNETAGSVAALAGHESAKALHLAASSSTVDQLKPEEAPVRELASDAVNEATGTDRQQVRSIDGEDLFGRVQAFLLRFISYPTQAAGVAHLLWITHSHLMGAWFSTPRLAVLSPEPGSGKSRLLEITALLVPRPLLSVKSSPAYVLRKIADQANRPTVLFDEIDTIFGPLAHGNEDLRAMINTGYRRGFMVGRCSTEKGKVVTEELDPYGAVAMGGLGDLPDTIMSRSVVIRMRKPAPGQTVEPFRPRLHEAEGLRLRDELANWAEGVIDDAREAEPVMPAGITYRHEDVWSPLLTVAALAGGRWTELANQAAIAFVQEAKLETQPSLGVQLLADILRCFEDQDNVASEELVRRLLEDQEAPWGDLRGRLLNQRTLAKMLRPYGIKSTVIRLGDSTPRGYKRESFHDAWIRYLPSTPSAATSATAATCDEKGDRGLASGSECPAPK